MPDEAIEAPDQAQPMADKAREDTFFLPADFPGHEDCKPGDTITLRVVGHGENGEVEVEHVGYDKGEPDWKTDLKQSMADKPDGAGGEEAGEEY